VLDREPKERETREDAMKLLNNLYVISLTHWDREWRFPFQKTRMLLVEIMDRLLDVLERNPDYRCFHLDGQTVLLDDCGEARPQNEGRIRRLVEEGRLLIGPWYTLPDENQVSGESLVRNFLWGERLGRRYGGVMKVGYTPTSWGQVSQMPQILRGVGIDSIIFYRGITADQVAGHYYDWEGPDGSRVLGVRLGDHARVAFFHLVDRRVAHNRGPEVTEHEWAWGGKPFRLCGSGSSAPYHFAFPPVGWHPERIEEAFTTLDRDELGQWETPFAPAFDGDDSTGPFELTPRIVEEANRRVTNGKRVEHTSLTRFIAEAQEHLRGKSRPLLRGEMRHPQRAGLFTDLYGEVQATRLPMKYMNRRAEFNLHRTAEPLATAAWLEGQEYPRDALDRANRCILQNHAHDSIGGCGRDEVNDEVQFRFRQADILSQTVIEDAARHLAGRIDTRRFDPCDILLIVFNPLPRPLTQVARAEIDVAKRLGVKGFRVYDLNGGEMPVQIEARDLPAMGYRVFRVEPVAGEMRHPGTLLTAPDTMENEHLTVRINPNGTADVTSRETGIRLRNQNSFEDRGEVGDYWVGNRPVRDRVCRSVGAAAAISVVEDGALRATFEARLTMDLPARATDDGTARAAETRPVALTTRYTLVKGERFLRIATTIENTVEDHVLRALFPTGVRTDVVRAETPFDVVARAIPLPDTRGWREPYRPTQPHQNFVDLSDGSAGVALLNRGLPQYEAVDDAERTLALTLLRAHRAWNSVRLARFPDQSGTQLQGTHTFEYALLPHRGDWEQGGVLYESERLNVPAVVGAAGPGPGMLPPSASFAEVEGEGLVMNAFKQSEWDETVILRLSNPTARPVEGALKLGFDPGRIEFVDLLESRAMGEPAHEGRRVPLSLGAGKVVTLRMAVPAGGRAPQSRVGSGKE
jgi:hypothetical protein